ncbi:unnamed protein product [Cylicostephanus goldi]|uniref:Uncharacterized protein n=1 Tax=Cylicostephanus goldi TaxID=71465 RepID=A0A3P6SMD4_CYLGO|nr:unnamed protein product [Cylicostephanus goldi]
MDLRYECIAIEKTNSTLSLLVRKSLDDLELIPSFIDRAEDNKVSVEDVKKLEEIVGLTLSNLSSISRKVHVYLLGLFS